MSRPLWPLHARRLAVLAGLGALLLLFAGGCEESLPPYEPPDIPLVARIEVDESVDANDLSTADNGFTVIVEHTGEFNNDFVLPGPYEVEAAITISMVSAPSRSITVTQTAQMDSSLHRGYWDFLLMNIPATDADGNRWNWPDNEDRIEVILQGKVWIQNDRFDLEINTPRAQTTLRYDDQQS